MQNNMQSDEERVMWQGTPSQWINYNKFTLCALLFLLAIALPSIWDVAFNVSMPKYRPTVMLLSKLLFFVPPVLAVYFYLRVSTHRYTLTTERMNEEFGILSKNTDVLELFRVKDISFSQPLALRVFGLGNIIMDTSDRSTPIVTIAGVQNGDQLTTTIRKQVDLMRTKKGVREID